MENSDLVYFAQRSYTGRWIVSCAALDPYLMTGDYPLFDTPESCIAFYAGRGLTLDS